ncbi:MAG: glycosyltransferase family 4 protein [Candidatus Krumholzibacteria bacterium]|nr:glycosyltransferase family 4 protein [Candidatus Krumholzibacteria bacterium]
MNKDGNSNLKIAMIGSKGLPALFGGIERHVEEIGRRLAGRGHEITVFGRKPFSIDGEHLGMNVRLLPSIPTKNLDAGTHSFIATMKALSGPFDIIHYHGIGPSLFAGIPVMANKLTVSTVHALDYRQSKWGRVVKYLLRKGEARAVRSASATIAVSKLMAEDLSSRYSSKVVYIPNGATLRESPPLRDLLGLGIESGKFILTVGRFIVERGFDTLLEAWSEIDTDMKLVIVGDERFEVEYARKLHGIADNRVIFPGYVAGENLDELYAHCAFYVLPSLVEGLPISLMEAMSFSRPVLISDIPENLEVAGKVGAIFKRGDKSDLGRGLREMIVLDDSRASWMGSHGRKKIEEEYNWDSVAERTERFYLDLIHGAGKQLEDDRM